MFFAGLRPRAILKTEGTGLPIQTDLGLQIICQYFSCGIKIDFHYKWFWLCNFAICAASTNNFWKIFPIPVSNLDTRQRNHDCIKEQITSPKLFSRYGNLKFEVVLQKQFLPVTANHLKSDVLPQIKLQKAGKFVKCIPEKFCLKQQWSNS